MNTKENVFGEPNNKVASSVSSSLYLDWYLHEQRRCCCSYIALIWLIGNDFWQSANPPTRDNCPGPVKYSKLASSNAGYDECWSGDSGVVGITLVWVAHRDGLSCSWDNWKCVWGRPYKLGMLKRLLFRDRDMRDWRSENTY